MQLQQCCSGSCPLKRTHLVLLYCMAHHISLTSLKTLVGKWLKPHPCTIEGCGLDVGYEAHLSRVAKMPPAHFSLSNNIALFRPTIKQDTSTNLLAWHFQPTRLHGRRLKSDQVLQAKHVDIV